MGGKDSRPQIKGRLPQTRAQRLGRSGSLGVPALPRAQGCAGAGPQGTSCKYKEPAETSRAQEGGSTGSRPGQDRGQAALSPSSPCSHRDCGVSRPTQHTQGPAPAQDISLLPLRPLRHSPLPASSCPTGHAAPPGHRGPHPPRVMEMV